MAAPGGADGVVILDELSGIDHPGAAARWLSRHPSFFKEGTQSPNHFAYNRWVSADLRLAPGILEEVVKHAKACYPKEGCGLIAGSDTGSKFFPMENVRMSSSEYEMDAARLISVLREIRNSGEQLVAIYHSHPFGPAKPSGRDIERAYYPEAGHLIVSLTERERPQAAAFRIIDGKALEVELHVIV